MTQATLGAHLRIETLDGEEDLLIPAGHPDRAAVQAPGPGRPRPAGPGPGRPHRLGRGRGPREAQPPRRRRSSAGWPSCGGRTSPPARKASSPRSRAPSSSRWAGRPTSRPRPTSSSSCGEPAPGGLADTVDVAGEDGHHLARVLRLRVGETVTVADGSGGWRPYRSARASGRRRSCASTPPAGPDREPAPRRRSGGGLRPDQGRQAGARRSRSSPSWASTASCRSWPSGRWPAPTPAGRSGPRALAADRPGGGPPVPPGHPPGRRGARPAAWPWPATRRSWWRSGAAPARPALGVAARRRGAGGRRARGRAQRLPRSRGSRPGPGSASAPTSCGPRRPPWPPPPCSVAATCV